MTGPALARSIDLEYMGTMHMLLANWSDFFSQDWVPLVIVVIAIALVVSSLRKRYTQGPKMPPASSGAASGPSRESAQRLRSEVESAIVELQNLSRRISSEIDTRFARLEAAISDADRRIATLQRLIEMADLDERPASRDAKEGERSTANMAAKSSSTDPQDRHSVVYEMADAGKSAIEIARQLGKTPGEVELILNLRKT